MTIEASEQLLKALENSKDDPSTLLEQAASIISVVYDQHNGHFKQIAEDTYGNSNSFREEWLLRWIVKKLNESVQDGRSKRHSDRLQQLVLNHRSWSFLSYLLGKITRQKSLKILLERSFTKLLTNASTSIVNDHQTIVTSQSLPLVDEDESQRPHKRLRLSPSPNGQLTPKPHSVATIDVHRTILFHYFNVVHIWGHLLEPEQQISSTPTRLVTPAWSDSIKDAADFVGQVLVMTQHLMNIIARQQVESVVSMITQWLGLWHTLAISNNFADKLEISKNFNDSCLKPCLKLYTLFSNAKQPSLIAVGKEIQRSIALYTILPLRSVFNTRFLAAWKADRTVIAWPDIEPVFKMLQNHLGAALHSENIANLQIVSLDDPKFASWLFSIASRLVPKDDIRRRQKESPWLQALTLCLAHLAYPKEMPKMHQDSNDLLKSSDNDLPPGGDVSKQWPGDFLTTVATADTQLSTAVKEYLISSMFAWGGQPLPLSLVSTIVDLDPGMFVPSIGGPNSAACLDGLLHAIAQQKRLSEIEYKLVIQSIICPIMQAYAKARDFDGLQNMWLPNLEEALRVRITAVFSAEEVPVALVWDDEDVVAEFTKLCQSQHSTTFDRVLLSDVVNELRTMPERIGPTTDIFAKLAMLECVIKARGKDLLLSAEIAQTLVSLLDLLTDAVKLQSSYQGQKWRLWSMIVALLRLDAQFDRFDTTASILKTAFKTFQSMETPIVDKLPQSQRSALLMEQYSIFSLLIEYYGLFNSSDKTSISVYKMLNKEIKHLAKMIEDFQGQQQDASIAQAVTSQDVLWDGRMNNLLSVKRLAQGQLACLVQKPGIFNTENTPILKLLTLLETPLRNGSSVKYHFSSAEDFNKVATSFLAEQYPKSNSVSGFEVRNEQQSENTDKGKSCLLVSDQRISQKSVDRIAVEMRSTSHINKLQDLVNQLVLLHQQPIDLAMVIHTGTVISGLKDADLKAMPTLAKSLALSITLVEAMPTTTLSKFVLRLEHCMLVLNLQPGVINQAIIDTLLKDLVILTSGAVKNILVDKSDTEDQVENFATAIFDRLVAMLGLLLSRYRRRLTGRTHLTLAVLQNLLRCFFYTPSRAYIYQNATTARQKQALRSSLPCWLDKKALPPSSAVRFSKIISSICNPTTASARSAHRSRSKNGSMSLELNDETQKAKRIASQYMQYLIMEYARCTLDGVVQPDVRENLVPGLYSILDAMDRDLMKAMNSAMDPSSRAIFKGLYDDWSKHWKWNQN